MQFLKSYALFVSVFSMVYGAPLDFVKRAESGNALLDGYHGSVTNSQQVMDTLSRQLQAADGHPTADILSAFLTGADSQIDNAIATVAEAISPLTLGASQAVGGAILGPFVQSVTNGAEVLIANLVAAPIDLVAGPAMKSLAKNMSRLSQQASQNNVNTHQLDKAVSQLNTQISSASKGQKLHARAETGNALLDGYHGSVTNSQQVMDTLSRQLQSADGHPTADILSAFLTGADSQIDNAIGTVAEAISPLTFGASQAVGGAILGPFVQSVTNGAEVLIANLVAAPIDLVAGPAMKSLAKNMSRLSQQASQNNVNTHQLDKAVSQLNTQISAASKGQKLHARAETGNALLDGYHGSVTNSQQVMDTLSRQLQAADGHPTADILSAFLTGADSQIDNAIGTVAEAISPLTFGASQAVGGAILGPFVQSVTNGAEVLIANLVAAPIDLVAGPAMKSLAKNMSRLSQQASQNNVNTHQLDKAVSQLNTQISAASKGQKLHARAETGNALLDGYHGSVINSQQVMDTLSRQLQSADGHPTADVLSAFLTGADSQIDNAVATVSEALAPLTFGASQAVGNFLLGPVVQSVTNGAEVLISNLIGAPVDLIAGPAMKSLAKNMSRLSQQASQNNVNTNQLNQAIAKLQVQVDKASKSGNSNNKKM